MSKNNKHFSIFKQNSINNNKQRQKVFLNKIQSFHDLNQQNDVLTTNSREEDMEDKGMYNRQIKEKFDYRSEYIIMNKIIPSLIEKKRKNSIPSQLELEYIIGYLDSLPNFINILKGHNSDFYKELLKNISLNLDYECNKKDRVLFKYGYIGEKAFIILKGECSVLVPNKEKVLITEEDYIEYLLFLREQEEYELLNMTLIDNKKIFNISIEDFDIWLEESLIRIKKIDENTENFKNFFREIFRWPSNKNVTLISMDNKPYKQEKQEETLNNHNNLSLINSDLFTYRSSIIMKNNILNCTYDIKQIEYNQHLNIDHYIFPKTCHGLISKIESLLEKIKLRRKIIEPDDQYIDKDEYIKKINKFSERIIVKKRRKNKQFLKENISSLHPNLVLNFKSRKNISAVKGNFNEEKEEENKSKKENEDDENESEGSNIEEKKKEKMEIDIDVVTISNQKKDKSYLAKLFKRKKLNIDIIKTSKESKDEPITVGQSQKNELSPIQKKRSSKDILSPMRNTRLKKEEFSSPSKKPKYNYNILNVISPKIKSERKPSLVKSTSPFSILIQEISKYNQNKQVKGMSSFEFFKMNLKKQLKQKIDDLTTNKVKKIFNIFYYEETNVLENGAFFGERALDNITSKRTATIICTEDTHLGVIDKYNYKLFLQDVSNKVRQRTINTIISNQLFKNIVVTKFEKQFYAMFSLKKHFLGEVLLKSKSKSEGVFLIKKGAFDIKFIGNLLDLDHMIEFLSDYSTKKSNYDESFMEKYEIEALKKQYSIKIYHIEYKKQVLQKERPIEKYSLYDEILSNEVLGIDDMLLPDDDTGNCLNNKCKSSLNLEVTSPEAVVYNITIDNFYEMINKDYTIYNNYLSIRKIRKEVMLNRLQTIRKSIMKSMTKKFNEIISFRTINTSGNQNKPLKSNTHKLFNINNLHRMMNQKDENNNKKNNSSQFGNTLNTNTDKNSHSNKISYSLMSLESLKKSRKESEAYQINFRNESKSNNFNKENSMRKVFSSDFNSNNNYNGYISNVVIGSFVNSIDKTKTIYKNIVKNIKYEEKLKKFMTENKKIDIDYSENIIKYNKVNPLIYDSFQLKNQTKSKGNVIRRNKQEREMFYPEKRQLELKERSKSKNKSFDLNRLFSCRSNYSTISSNFN